MRLHRVDEGAGPPILLLHGLGCSSRIWSLTVADLRRDHRVLAVDLPGFGGSPPPKRNADFRVWADAVADVVGELRLGQVHVVGHSMGGLVAQRLTDQHPRLAASLMLVSSAGPAVSRARSSFIRSGLFALGMLGAAPIAGFARGTSPALARLALRRVVARPAALSDEARGLLLDDFDPSGVQAAVRAGRQEQRLPRPTPECRTLVLWGSRDRVFPVAAGRTLLPHCPHLEWAGVGHMPMLEAPGRFSALVRAFVAGTALPDSAAARIR